MLYDEEHLNEDINRNTTPSFRIAFQLTKTVGRLKTLDNEEEEALEGRIEVSVMGCVAKSIRV